MSIGVMVISFSSQHSPLVDFNDQPTCSVQQGQNPHFKNGELDDLQDATNSQDNCGAPKTQVRQDGYVLVQKKVTKTVVVVAECTCIVYLYASQAGRQLSCNTWNTLPTVHWAAEVLRLDLLLTERMHTAIQIPQWNQHNSFLHIPKTGYHCP